MEACKENRDGLKQLSMERIRDELFKLFLTPKVVETLQIMYDNEILSYVFPDTHYLEELDFLVNTIDVKDLPNARCAGCLSFITPTPPWLKIWRHASE